METQYLKDYSPALGRDMEIQFYDNAGQLAAADPLLYQHAAV